MAKVTTSKSDGKRYLNMDPAEYSGALRQAVERVFELREVLRAAEATAVEHHDEAFPELSQHPIQFKWGKVSVSIDATRERQAKASSSPKMSLADYIASQERGGRRA